MKSFDPNYINCFKTSEFTVDDIAEALDRGKCWLKQKNGKT